MMILRQPLSVYNPLNSVRNWMVCMSAFCVVVAPHNAHLGGGTLKNTADPRHYYKPYAFYSTAVIVLVLSAWMVFKTRSAYFAAAVLVTAHGSAQKA